MELLSSFFIDLWQKNKNNETLCGKNYYHAKGYYNFVLFVNKEKLIEYHCATTNLLLPFFQLFLLKLLALCQSLSFSLLFSDSLSFKLCLHLPIHAIHNTVIQFQLTEKIQIARTLHRGHKAYIG